MARVNLATAIYRRTSLPFRIAFKALAALRSSKTGQTLGANLDSYLEGHTGLYFQEQWAYGYHRVFDLVRNLPSDRDPSALHVLSLGPRTEIELYYLRLFCGFTWNNITGADLVSTSPKIKVADMSIKLPFPDNSFDVIVASHCLEKSRNPEITRDEIRRVAKPGARVLVCGNVPPDDTTLTKTIPVVIRYFRSGVYGLIDLYGLDIQHIEYMKAQSPHGFEIIFRVTK
jgi:SAM-dependent methyltransferase